ncbi:unnamed protein product [Linum tenue]|uniref:ZNF380 coiled-coil domain-containing protein n=1 Tax=Linum tenue TaxID=586396 RepID=A0AAV0RFY9_9ROSI|nr:unnamed protein product [Linum tenue]
MDKKKAFYRAKLNAQKKDKRIDSPLVRYNESDQPVCRVCNLVLKESQWDAHQASRKHREVMSQFSPCDLIVLVYGYGLLWNVIKQQAIDNLKANAARKTDATNSKPVPRVESNRSASANNAELHAATVQAEPPTKVSKPQSSSALPPGFFDNNGTKAHKTGTIASLLNIKLVRFKQIRNSFSDPQTKLGGSLKPKKVESLVEDKSEALPTVSGSQQLTAEEGRAYVQTQTNATDTEIKQVKGSLPEGFFDNKEADLHARGIKIVKPDVNDEYKEFEKLIQEDVREVDDRLEEEEFDAAEKIEEAESVEQKVYMQKVEQLKRKKMELMAAKSAKRVKGRDSQVAKKGSTNEDTSSDSDDDEDFTVDWRAQHL